MALYIQALKSLSDVGSSAIDQIHSQKTLTTGLGFTGLRPLDASRLTSTHATNSRAVPLPNSPEVLSGETCTDHMITCQWTENDGWLAPELKPYGPLSLMPTSSSLHYAIECFEGLKLYRGFDGRLRLFRPLRNAVRMLDSAKRISLPSFGPEEWVKLVAKLCAVDGPKWLPKERSGHFLYIRPTLISNDPSLSVKRPARALFYIIISCLPAIDERKKGLRLLASQADMVRAWPGGFGHVKLGANYGPSMFAGDEAKKKGFEQVLWLFRNENGISEVTEAGASNFMLVWRTREGQMQLVTAPIDRQIILDGITRRSILDLAKERLGSNSDGEGGGEKVEVLERRLSMDEIVVACEENRIVEAFAVGTSYFVSPVSFIQYGEKALEIPMVEGSTGVYARLFKTWLKVIMYGLEKHYWAYLVESKE